MNMRIKISFILTVIFMLVFNPSETQTQTGIQFNGTNQYVNFGSAPSLNTPTFTIELWFKRLGTGTSVTTGTGGISDAIPLLTKGTSEVEDTTKDINYFLAIKASSNVICADFEAGSGSNASQNYPITGVTPIQYDVWYHVAATYDGVKWRLYLNGKLESELIVNRMPTAHTISPAALGSSIKSNGTAQGFFNGIIDEARIWNYARPQDSIIAYLSKEILNADGLLGRWGLNEGTGTTVYNSVTGGVNGTLINSPTWTNGATFNNFDGLKFGGTNAYITFGNNSALGLAQFTIETWFKKDGSGTPASTGTGGIIAIPLVTKGRGEADGDTRDMNYFLGIDTSSGAIAADFEDIPSGANHPIIGTTRILNNLWYHAAVTYNGSKLQLFLNGNLENEITVNKTPQSNSIQHAAIASALTSNGTAQGFFNGVLDEVRIWNYARTESEIQSTINTKIEDTLNGLVARWSLDVIPDTIINSTAGITINGIIKGTNWYWNEGAPFNISFLPPNAPSNLLSSNIYWHQVDLSWQDNSNNENIFEIERSTTGINGTFSLIGTVSSNTQNYTNTNLKPKTEYCYRVRAKNSGGYSDYSNIICITTPNETSGIALKFNGNTHVSFGNPSELKLNQFTIETWFRREGNGTTANTGTGGVYAIPLVTKGVGETEQPQYDMNYFLGIRDTTGTLVADFEEGASGSSPSLNHPVVGVTPIQYNRWYHAAATYDGNTWKLYLDGNLEAELFVGQPVASGGNQHAGLASALNSSGTPNGYFIGTLDEVRIWNYARTQQEILSTINTQLVTPTNGLVARWGLNEGIGIKINSTAGTDINGGIIGSSYQWVNGAPFNLPNNAPSTPTIIYPPDQSTDVSVPVNLSVQVYDLDNDNLTVKFFGRLKNTLMAPNFNIVVLPDAQYYTSETNGGSNALFKAQTQFIVNKRDLMNIVYVTQLGDLVENGDTYEIEWKRADTTLSILENAVPQIPYGIAIGNHDIINGDNLYNQYFGISRFQGKPYFGGYYGNKNNNNYHLISVSGLDFIIINLEYNCNSQVLHWADSLLKFYNNRRAIVVNHSLIGTSGTFTTFGQTLYDSLKDNSNLFLMLCGHSPGEGRRMDVYNNDTVFTLLADYQNRTNGGDSWLRILEFSPSNNKIFVYTYNPVLNQYETDENSQFVLNYNMDSTYFTEIGSVTNVTSGSMASVEWSNILFSSLYEWYVTVSDGNHTIQSPIWTFTTESNPVPIQLAEFTASFLQENNSVKLAWTTISEINNYGFYVERSFNSPNNFQELPNSFIPGAGYSLETHHYEYIDNSIPSSGKYYYRLKQIDNDGLINYSFSVMVDLTITNLSENTEIPKIFRLYLNYPNPFNPTTKISFSLARDGYTTLKIYNMLGEEVATLFNGNANAGKLYVVEFTGENLPSGVYISRLQSGNDIQTKKMMLMK